MSEQKETKWTNGPWFKSGKPSGYNWCEIRAPRAEGATITVATITHWNPEVNDHNAHLIAAAPLLYEALDNFRTCHELGQPPSSDDIKVMYLAMKKARGE